MIANAMTDLQAQVQPGLARGGRASQALSEGGGAQVQSRDVREITEGDAVIAYLQMLGTLVDFKHYDDKANLR